MSAGSIAAINNTWKGRKKSKTNFGLFRSEIAPFLRQARKENARV